MDWASLGVQSQQSGIDALSPARTQSLRSLGERISWDLPKTAKLSIGELAAQGLFKRNDSLLKQVDFGFESLRNTLVPRSATLALNSMALQLTAERILGPSILATSRALSHQLASTLKPDLTSMFQLGAVRLPKITELFLHSPNLVASGADLEVVAAIAYREGIPFAWVPRSSIIKQLVDATDAESRTHLLLENRAQIVDDCYEALVDVSDTSLGYRCSRAVKALEVGLDEPAQALAANLIEGAAKLMRTPHTKENFKQLAESRWRRLGHDQSVGGYLTTIATLPLRASFTGWNASKHESPPDSFARHATAHGAHLDTTYRPEFAILAVMLATSLVVEVDRRTLARP